MWIKPAIVALLVLLLISLGSGFFFLRDSNSGGPANHAFGYGAEGETPVVGNWAG